MSSHVIDMIMLQNNFGTPEMREIWCDKNRLQKHLDVEAALALAEGELGVIPEIDAKKISESAKAELFNIEEIAAEVARVKHSLTPTINALQALAGEYVHYGVTTQDVVDTGTILQLKEAHGIIIRELKDIIKELARLASKYRNTPMAGRSHGMQALPTTFGFKMAVVLSETVRHYQRLKEVEDRIFTGVLGGAIGTYASFGEKGIEIEELALKKLGLNAPEICWHSSRDRISEYASILGLISGTLGKVGNEFYNLMRTEINELEEPFSSGKIGSSTMPHKRNPAALEGLASLTKPIFHSVALVHESLMVEHERDAMSWRAEWIALPEICIYLSAQLSIAKNVLKGLVVKPENMLRNLNLQGGLILSEKVMFDLAKAMGKQTAHKLVYQISMDAIEKGRSFEEELIENSEVNSVLTVSESEELLKPENYLGLAPEKVDQVLENVKKLRLLD